MLKYVALALLLAGQGNPAHQKRTHTEAPPPPRTLEDYEFRSPPPCNLPATKDFGCALLWNFDPPPPEGIASISGGDYDTIRRIILILDGTEYTVVYDPPLTKKDGLTTLRRGACILAKIEGDYVIIRLPDGKEEKGKIESHENLRGNRPQPA